MRTYEVVRCNGKPDWNTVPVAPIDNPLWTNVPEIVPSAQVCWDEQALYVRLQTLERHILRRFTGKLDPVCQDSCLEFFFCTEDNSDRYFNFEANPNGALYVGFGRPGSQRCRLYRENFAEIFQVEPFDIPGGWGLQLRIPLQFIQIYAPEFTLCPGKTIRANFYKCGDETEQEHYFAWNPVDLPAPNFHCPEFFAPITLK